MVSHTFKDFIQEFIEGESFSDIPRDERVFLRYLYHFTDILNAVSILKTKKVLSRNEVIANGLMNSDNASADVINGSPIVAKESARFYFRPKTPTQYRNEGVLSQAELDNSVLKAHCPIPVFFLFSASEILGTDGVFFTEESLAKHHDVKLKSTLEEFKKLPFKEILHNRPYPPENKQLMNMRRQAEVVCNAGMSLDALKGIIVRSVPEKEFLLSLLSEKEKEYYSDLIFIDSKKLLFFGSRAYLSKVTLDEFRFIFDFNLGLSNPEYIVKIEVDDDIAGSRFWGPNKIRLSEMPNIRLPEGGLHHYVVRVFLNDILIYQNRFDSDKDDLPF
ncbi:DarT ssDNA thymidine ADP-ribosyltransferase family protein [Enterococcus sp. DIV0098]|uniref:DarT ssDNA thymidine ADP-ribosyltransferase family protein n=1 Tax=Enterococcus sp. DIV0098 TaxID=2774843 RepID=UPI003F27A202